MEFLKRNFAPITQRSWAEIDKRFREIMKSNLYARRVVDLHGPMGWEFSALPLGEVVIKSSEGDKVKWGIRKVLPVIELRSSFSLNIWKLDDIERGAENIDLTELEEAAKNVAAFEDEIVFYGCPEYGIAGLLDVLKDRYVTTEKQLDKFIGGLFEAIQVLKEDGIVGPYNLLVNKEVWNVMITSQDFAQRYKVIEKMLEGGTVIPTPRIPEAMLLAKGGHFKLFIGQDLSVGYEGHTAEMVNLFITETMTFVCVNPLGGVLIKF
ncbi:family 1 encapsulin nanocompartment shell protein [Fervidobacterium thailandense]|uniref:Maritimacin n=1 Tax=Fervidobacterium thailandense TaxID=1008305 RepID=A0A1E3G387_9BACT|nr:family 1 encapsulin nanocompartment shell protein [Fervidobacterium thailandense]ODN30148.1 hypothetical protein A4H02_06895 [Fervidobacterium thailandense]